MTTNHPTPPDNDGLTRDADVATVTATPSKQVSRTASLDSNRELKMTDTLCNTDDGKTVNAVSEKGKVDSPGVPPTESSTSAAPGGVLTGLRLYLVFAAMMLSVFMFALDGSIVAAAIPIIVSEFQAFSRVAWLITAYFLTQCGLILLVGQTLTIIKAKWLIIISIFFFEVGSLLCALSNNMDMLIASRAIQGVGASGMFVSIMSVISVVTAVESRAAFMTGFGFVFVISSVIGPLLGGVFTEQLSWRWCFWINLPVGGVAIIAIVFLLPARDPEEQRPGQAKGWQAVKEMDWLGSALAFVFVTCLLLALQWGGNEYPWGNWRVILLFILGGVTTFAFFAWQWYRNEKALIPRSIMTNRTVLGASLCLFMLMASMLGGTYQLPLYYQAARGQSATKSAISVLPLMIMTCAGIFVSGGVVAKTGHYLTFILIGPPIAAVGYGLMFSIREDTSNANIIGYQILAGFGVGLAFQNVILGVQAEFADRTALIPQATGVASFFQLTGAALGIGIINTVQSIYLQRYLREYAPDAPFEVVRQSTTAIYEIAKELQSGVIHSYILAISKSYIPIFIALPLAVVGGALIRNHNMIKLGIKATMVA